MNSRTINNKQTKENKIYNKIYDKRLSQNRGRIEEVVCHIFSMVVI